LRQPEGQKEGPVVSTGPRRAIPTHEWNAGVSLESPETRRDLSGGRALHLSRPDAAALALSDSAGGKAQCYQEQAWEDEKIQIKVLCSSYGALGAGPAMSAGPTAEMLAYTCAGCHGTDGSSIAGLDAASSQAKVCAAARADVGVRHDRIIVTSGQGRPRTRCRPRGSGRRMVEARRSSAGF